MGTPYSARVLACVMPVYGGVASVMIAWTIDAEWHRDDGKTMASHGAMVTHWMPLPELPLAESVPS
jgi:hypothetical protein